MSAWYESSKDDLEIDGDEINVYVHGDDFGGVYTTIKISDIEELLEQHRENKQ